ncbi:TetR family transcriptional regulator [Prauserella rugosa]|uniref:TetR family transcriptional regulator n=1 Tax=Prauserella rugosa TaxID=43354 RepID=UPI0009FE9FA5|nr:TetR family transcriptional regulator [Prauserella rugosa]
MTASSSPSGSSSGSSSVPPSAASSGSSGSAAVSVASSSNGSPRPRAGRTEAGRRKVRRLLTHAAIDLFLSHGYDTTTVDDIAAAAGVGRRTFFRYFRSKEDSIFPNHDDLLADIERMLAEADPGVEDPVDAVCRAVRLVLDSYLDDPDVSLKRYRLTRTVTSLRDKEVASVDRYQRVFTRYLRERFHDVGDPAADMRAPIVAAAVAAAHNHVLRQWLHSGGTVDAHGLADRAFAMVRRASATPGPATGSTATSATVVPATTDTATTADGTVVTVFTTSTPTAEVVRRINAALAD